MPTPPSAFTDSDQVRGIDVSHHNETIDWGDVAQAGIQFAYIKATESAGFKDVRFRENYDGCKQANILRGAYHFFRANVDALAQANSFSRVVRQLDSGDLPPVIDVESVDGTSISNLLKGMMIWLRAVEDALGRKPVIYTGSSFWSRTIGSDRFNEIHLWVAQYTARPTPTVPKGFNDYRLWQFSQTGRVGGISGNVDLNRFNGTLAELQALAGIEN